MKLCSIFITKLSIGEIDINLWDRWIFEIWISGFYMLITVSWNFGNTKLNGMITVISGSSIVIFMISMIRHSTNFLQSVTFFFVVGNRLCRSGSWKYGYGRASSGRTLRWKAINCEILFSGYVR